MEFHRHLKNKPDRRNSTDLAPVKLVIRLNPMDRLGRVPRGTELPEAHTGRCIISRTTANPHMVPQEDAPVYYLHVILLIRNILTRTTEVMELEQTMENV